MDNSEKIERTLNSIEGTQRAKANPFMFEKIKQRMAAEGKTKSGSVKFILATALTVIIVAVINITVWTSYSSSDYTKINNTQNSSKQDISTFAKEYFDQSSQSNY
jgi:flagellar basal body-associated protein FliL